jgi:internalin A
MLSSPLDKALLVGARQVNGSMIALERIAQEAKEKTGFLDPGRLGLSALPDELFQLRHLRGLDLGSGYFDEGGHWKASASNIEADSVAAILVRLVDLTELRHLWLANTRLSDLAPLRSLTDLQTLDCSRTPVSDLAPLQGLTSLQRLNCSGCQIDSVPQGFWFKSSLEQVWLCSAGFSYRIALCGIDPQMHVFRRVLGRQT